MGNVPNPELKAENIRHDNEEGGRKEDESGRQGRCRGTELKGKKVEGTYISWMLRIRGPTKRPLPIRITRLVMRHIFNPFCVPL